jgi:hypothetical protein
MIMKKRILFAFATLTVLSLAIAAFAYGNLAVSSVGDTKSCCKKDSCPMKKKVGTATAVSLSDVGKSCCDNCDCCKAKAKTDTAAV